MGQKTHPYGFRLSYNKTWHSRWYAAGDYAGHLHQDLSLRARLKRRLSHAGVSEIDIERAARSVEKLVRSAVANAENRDEDLDLDRLYVKEIFVDGGPALKRIWFTTMGRAYRKLKRQSHVTIKLDTHPEGESGRRR